MARVSAPGLTDSIWLVAELQLKSSFIHFIFDEIRINQVVSMVDIYYRIFL
jgi:hypothetical protein